jgi:TonB family protein
MKICPSCQRTFEDDGMSFCLDDGTPLASAPAGFVDPGATMKIPAARLTNQAATEILPGEDVKPTLLAQAAPARQLANEAQPASAARKPNPLPWILGAALILGLSGIVIALIVTRNGGGGPQSSQTAQTGNQSGNTASVTDSNIMVTDQRDVSVPAPSPLTAGETPGEAQASRTPGQLSPTPKQTPTPRSTPSTVVEDGPPPTPVATSAPRPRAPISGGVLNGKAISKPAPPYPALAKAARASGTVVVQVTVDESGKVISARAISGHPLLQQASVQAAYAARFSPTLLSGQPVKVTGTLTYNFAPQ